MANSIELPKIPFHADAPLSPAERDALPFSSVPLGPASAADRAAATAASQKAGDFEAYLNRRSILKLSSYRKKTFDTAAEVLRVSVYKPIETRRGK